MRLRPVIAAFAGTALAAAALYVTPAANAIVGGSNAGPYAFMASLELNGAHWCGGAIIQATWVVTAAHCVHGKNATDFKVRYGSTLSGSGGVLADVDQLIGSAPSGGGEPFKNHDIALVHMNVPTAQQTTPIPIAAEAGPAGTATRILGWGYTCQPSDAGCTPSISPDLKELDTSILAPGKCGEMNVNPPGGGAPKTDPIIGSKELCTDNPGGHSGACFGDSGGPQIKGGPGSWQLIGVTSRGADDERCAENPTVYTDVTQYRSWIQEQIDGQSGRTGD